MEEQLGLDLMLFYCSAFIYFKRKLFRWPFGKYTEIPLSNFIYGVSFFQYEMQLVSCKSVFRVPLVKTFPSLLMLPMQYRIPFCVARMSDCWTHTDSQTTIITTYLLPKCFQQFITNSNTLLKCGFVVQWLSSFKGNNIFNISVRLYGKVYTSVSLSKKFPHLFNCFQLSYWNQNKSFIM